ncbi:MAG: hypothetical protein U0002_01885 [Thermoanaerobaculia bacterium]
MSADPEHRAELLVAKALRPTLGQHYPPGLGRSAFRAILLILERDGFCTAEHAQAALSFSLDRARLEVTERSFRHQLETRNWFLELCQDETQTYLGEILDAENSPLLDLLQGVPGAEPDYELINDPRVVRRVREAIWNLPLPYRRFLVYDLIEMLPPELIRHRLELPSRAAFLRLKRESLAALRDMLPQVLGR